MPIRIDLKPEFFTERRHPAYAGMVAHWDFVEATYRGGPTWFEENLHTYKREGEKSYKERKKRGYRFNHTREVVDLITKYVFKGDISRSEDAPEEIKNFWKRATKRGGDIETLMREVSRATSIYGQPYVIVDSSAAAPEKGGPLSVADAKKIDARVFAYVVRPQDALDMSFDERGELNWFLHREGHRDDAEFGNEQVSETRYRLWTRNSWTLFRVRDESDQERARGVFNTAIRNVTRVAMPSGIPAAGAQQSKLVVEQIDTGEHGLGRVPVVAAPDRDSDDEYYSPALVDDIAYLDRAVANYLSNLDQIIQDQTFSTLTIPVQALDHGDADEYNRVIQAGTKSILAFDGEGGGKPEYISPDPRQATLITAVITKIITEIYHSVGMAGERTKMDNAAGIDNSSGVAKAYDFDRMNTTLKGKADRLQAVEREIAELVMLWHRKSLKASEELIVYPDDFDVRNLYDEFDVANRLTLLGAPEKLRRHQLTSLIEKLYPTLSKDLRKAIEKELKEWPQSEEVDLTTAPSKLQDRKVPKADNKQGQNNKDAPKSGAA